MKYATAKAAGLLAAVLTLSGGYWAGLTNQARAQTILQEQGTLAPAQAEYTIETEAGDVLAIILTSEDFDTVLTLLGPDGEEVAFNDDYGGTLNSRIVYTVPTSGRYTVITQSYDGQGGDYDLEVRPATAYEVAFNEAQNELFAGNYDAAIAAFSEAIDLDPDNPEAYLGRADAYFGQAQAELDAQGLVLEEPDDLPENARDAIVSDFQAAADLYDEAGESATAQSLRDQILYIQTGEFPGPGG